MAHAGAGAGHTGHRRADMTHAAQARAELQQAVRTGRADEVWRLRRGGARLPRGGEALLSDAALAGHADVLTALLTPLPAPQAGTPPTRGEAVGLLLDAPPATQCASPAALARALQSAAEGGHVPCLQLLLVAGARVQPPPAVQARGGDAALCLAAGRGHAPAVATLLHAGAPPTTRALQYATQYGHAEAARELLRAGAPPDGSHGSGDAAPAPRGGVPGLQTPAWTPHRTTALAMAVHCGHDELAEALLAAGASVHADCAAPLWATLARQRPEDGSPSGVVGLLWGRARGAVPALRARLEAAGPTPAMSPRAALLSAPAFGARATPPPPPPPPPPHEEGRPQHPAAVAARLRRDAAWAARRRLVVAAAVYTEQQRQLRAQSTPAAAAPEEAAPGGAPAS